MNTRTTSAPIVAAVLCLLTSGCTGTDVLTSGNFVVEFETAVSTAGAVDYNCVLADIGDLKIRPTDPRAAQFLGSASLSVANTLNEVQFAGADCAFSSVKLPSLVLSSGEYIIDALRLGPVRLIEEQSGASEFCGLPADPLAPNEGCPDPALPQCFAAPVTFRVGRDEPNRVRLLLDVAEIESILQVDPFCTDFRDRVNDVLRVE